MSYYQCDQIGRFLKVLCNKCYFKISPNICATFWGILNYITFILVSFGHLLENLGYFLFHHLVTLCLQRTQDKFENYFESLFRLKDSVNYVKPLGSSPIDSLSLRRFPLLAQPQNEMSNRISPTVKHVWKVAMHVQHNLFFVCHKHNSLLLKHMQP